MKNPRFEDISSYRDIESLNMYEVMLEKENQRKKHSPFYRSSQEIMRELNAVDLREECRLLNRNALD